MITPTLKHVKLIIATDDKRTAIRKLHEVGVLHVTETKGHDDLQDDTSLEKAEAISDLLLDYQYIKRVTGAAATTSLDALPALNRVIDEATTFRDTWLDDIQQAKEDRDHHQDRTEAYDEQLRILRDIPQTYNDHTNPAIFTAPHSIDAPETTVHVKANKKHYYAATGDGIEKARTTKTLIDHDDTERIDLSYVENTIAQAKKQLVEQRKHHEEQHEQAQQRLEDLAETIQPKYKFLHTCLQSHYDELTLPNKFKANEDITVIEGYCEPDQLTTIESALPEATIYEETADEAPTKLKDNGANQSFRTITELFDTPRYGSFDPTSYVTLFFPLFFGFMLSDIGYGILVLLTALGINEAYDNTDQYTTILSVSGTATIMFGILFGSFFGELIPLEPLWTAQFEASFTILIVALIIGLIHMNLGVLTNLYQHIQQRRPWHQTLTAFLPLPITQASTALTYYGYTYTGITGFIIATALLTKRDGLIGVLGLSDYLGTWFSYARLLALSLATAGIALAVNIIASKASGVPVLGTILHPATLIIGHTFNYAVNLLGSTINAARLHYVEFFNLFFQGGGTPFNAFKLP